ncbi:MAG: bacterial Ig-like domain-containing protein, partial [Clostridia bacterium]|nr:bacterial Ig-like domain-containing protein [Clostridia bacterium]
NIQSDKFVLYVKSSSNFATSLKNLKAGDDISIQVNETNAAARPAMENALSTITNVGWLVKNGVDQTRIQSEIGGHGVTMQLRQTVFGQKPDGTYIFLTTEGAATGTDGSLTLRDAADYFISQGCTNVIRMDGGGSSGMYVKNKAGTGSAGYTQQSQRAVADSILIVKQSSIGEPTEDPDVSEPDISEPEISDDVSSDDTASDDTSFDDESSDVSDESSEAEQEVPKPETATYRTAANGPSSSYQGGKYYQHFTKIPLTGDGATDTLALALSQLGYHEGASTSDMDGISSSNGNYTEFNYNMGSTYTGGYTYEWCASFCSWALYQAYQTDHGSGGTYQTLCRYHKGDPEYIWREVGCGHWVNNLKSAGIWKNSQYYGGSYKPQPGDLIFFRSAAHIGMVVYSDSSYVYTVEGNTSDAAGVEPAGGGVYFKKYALSSSSIDGYGHLPYKTDSSVMKIDYSGANPTAGLYISNAVKYVYEFATSTTVKTNMPRFTLFEVTEIASNGRLKATYKTSSGTTVTGWILNNTDRVIQITNAVSDQPIFPAPPSIPTEGLILKDGVSSVNLYLGDTYTAEFEVFPEDANDSITLTASNSNVTIDGHEILGRYSGTTVVTATAESGVSYGFTVNVIGISGIEISSLPNKTQYALGDEFDTTGLIVRVKYNDGTYKTVTDYTISGFDSSIEGTQNIIVKWTSPTGNTYSKTLTVEVFDMSAPQEIYIASLPNKIIYNLRESLDLTGLVVMGIYRDGSEVEITDYTVSGYNALVVGKQTITIKYNDLTTTFDVLVGATAIEVSKKPKTMYSVGE